MDRFPASGVWQSVRGNIQMASQRLRVVRVIAAVTGLVVGVLAGLALFSVTRTSVGTAMTGPAAPEKMANIDYANGMPIYREQWFPRGRSD